ncbi:MAG: TlpA family protein disulfide reductase [Chloroflexi bacterium]|nr:TlpA family protein disulfide reductase [Chloroflexota bacterium]
MEQDQPISNENALPESPPQRNLMLLLGGGLLVGVIMAAAVIVGGEGALAPTANEGNVIINSSGGGGAPVEGEPAPDFVGMTPDGEELALSDLRGRPVAINFWATWCGPCRVEMPDLEAASQHDQKEGLVVLGVNIGETEEEVRAFYEELGVTFPTVLDPNGDIVETYRVRGFPTTVWVDADGNVFSYRIGVLTESEIEETVALLSN